MGRRAKIIGVLLLGWGAVRAARLSRAHGTVLYDGLCPLCLGAVARLRRWDTARRLEYLDARDTDSVAARFPRIAHDTDLREMRLVLSDGTVLGGFDAVRAVAALLPRFRPVAPLLFLPGMRPLGVLAYRFVAKHRPQTFHCTEDHCAVRGR